MNVGVSIDEQLYIKRHPGGIVTLRQDEIIQDSLLKKHKTSNKAVSKTASTTDDNDQDKLSRKEKQKVCLNLFGKKTGKGKNNQNDDNSINPRAVKWLRIGASFCNVRFINSHSYTDLIWSLKLSC